MNHYLRLGKRWLREKSYRNICRHVALALILLEPVTKCINRSLRKGGQGWVGQIDIQMGTQTQISEFKQRRLRRQPCTWMTYISLPSLHDYDVEISNFTFCGECEYKTTTLFSFPELQYSHLKFNSRKKLPTFDELKETE